MNYVELLPKPLLWKRWAGSPFATQPNAVDLGAWIRQDAERNSLRALVSVDLFHPEIPEAGHWLHISVSRRNRLPTWGDLVLGDRCFVQLLPPKRAWVNIHSYCLHLVHRLDAPSVPEILWDQEGADGANYRDEGAVVGRRVT